MKPLRFISIAVYLFLTATQVHAVDPSDGRRRLQDFLEGLSTLTAQFQQQLFDEYGELIETSEGDVAISRPGKFRWSYHSPYSQLIVTDGETLWIYDADLEQVSVNPFTNTTAGSPAQLLVGELDIDEHYSSTERRDDSGVIWISLTPHERATQYDNIDIAFDNDGLTAMRLRDNLNQLTVIDFQALAHNVDIAPENFYFVPPDGVDVMRGTGN